ncbi:hypothetical protein BD779DRAFT_1445058 [Infundibulicybe gibba]|nr:hypothetical protein BD779DRAFT_1445058 [Infundibulicybe gibba]
MLRSVLSLSLLINVCLSLSTCPSATAAVDYDYAVVGAGAGGGPLAARLAEAGYSANDCLLVLVVEAGHDPNEVNTTIPLFFGRAVDADLQLELNYTLTEYPVGFKVQRNNVWYPRARGIGGSTVHNDLINIIAGTTDDFNNLATTFNDTTWTRKNMQNYFKKIEKNLYLPSSATDHGFSGWLKTSLNPDPTTFVPGFHGPLLFL